MIRVMYSQVERSVVISVPDPENPLGWIDVFSLPAKVIAMKDGTPFVVDVAASVEQILANREGLYSRPKLIERVKPENVTLIEKVKP